MCSQSILHGESDRLLKRSRAYWTLKTADQWLSLRLDFIGSCLILLTAMLAISERNHISPSIAALSLSQVGLSVASIACSPVPDWLQECPVQG